MLKMAWEPWSPVCLKLSRVAQGPGLSRPVSTASKRICLARKSPSPTVWREILRLGNRSDWASVTRLVNGQGLHPDSGPLKLPAFSHDTMLPPSGGSSFSESAKLATAPRVRSRPGDTDQSGNMVCVARSTMWDGWELASPRSGKRGWSRRKSRSLGTGLQLISICGLKSKTTSVLCLCSMQYSSRY